MDDFTYIDVLFQNDQHLPMTQADAVVWANAHGLTFPVLADGNATVWADYASPGGLIPTNLVIGADFTIRYFDAGVDDTGLKNVIEPALCEILPSGTVVGRMTCP